MGEFLSPGIFITERASAAQVIQGVSTSNMAIIGFTKRGAVNSPSLVTSFEQFGTEFGQILDTELVPITVAAFFANDGARAFVCRVVGTGAVKSTGGFIGGTGTAQAVFAVGIGTGIAVTFTGTLPIQTSSQVVPGTVSIVAGGVTVVDTDLLNGTGTLAGAGLVSGTVNYVSGAVSLTYSVAVAFDVAINASYQTFDLWNVEADWEGEQGDGIKVVVSGNVDSATTVRNLTTPGLSYSRYDLSVALKEPYDDAAAAYETRESFADLVFNNATDVSFVEDAVNAASAFINVLTATAVGNPKQLNSKSVINEVLATGNGVTNTFASTLAQGSVVRNSISITYSGSVAQPTQSLVTGNASTGPFGGTITLGVGAVLAKQLVNLSWRRAGTPVAAAVLDQGDGITANHALSISGGFIRNSLTIDWNEQNVAATGSMTFGGAPTTVLDGQTFTLNDGVNPPITFEFDTDSTVSAANIAVDISAAVTDDNFKTATISAINGAPVSFLISAASGGVGIVNLTNGGAGSLGNTVITETVADASFTKVNFSGGSNTAQSATDNGAGALTGNATGSVNYTTGAILLQTGANIPTGANITADYDPPVAVSVTDTGLGTFVNAALASGSVVYTTGVVSITTTAAIPLGEVVTATFSTASGTQTITDNGDGFLVGSVSPSGANTIDYTNGSYAFTTATVPEGSVTVKAYYGKAPETTSLSLILTGGADGAAVTRANVSSPTLEASNSGIFALDTVDDILQMVIPDFAGDAIVSGDQIDYAEARKDVFCVLSTAKGKTAQQAVDHVRLTLNRNTSFAAMYWPWITIADPLRSGRVKNIPVVGHVAGVYARTDNTRNVGKAPAGINDGKLNFSVGLERITTKGERDLVYPARINPLIDSPATGRAVWGSKTLSLGSDFAQINARRLFIFAEKSVFNSTQFIVFESIGAGLFQQIRLTLNGFFTTLFNNGYLAGSSPAEAFFVIVDSSNNPAAQIAQGILVIDVGLAPNDPAQFVNFRFQRKILG